MTSKYLGAKYQKLPRKMPKKKVVQYLKFSQPPGAPLPPETDWDIWLQQQEGQLDPTLTTEESYRLAKGNHGE